MCSIVRPANVNEMTAHGSLDRCSCLTQQRYGLSHTLQSNLQLTLQKPCKQHFPCFGYTQTYTQSSLYSRCAMSVTG